MQVEQFQAIIIGSGQGGGPLATDLAEAGWKTALIEKGNPGGTCVNRGCTPTKTVAASARVAHLVSRAGDFGVRTGPVVIDLPAILNRKDDVVEMFRKSVKKSFKNVENLTYISGEARFTGEKEIEVQISPEEKRQLRADTIVINTGSRPAIPDIPGLAETPYLTSRSILDVEHVPAELLIIGGGYVGVEYAQMFRRFGSEVYIAQRGEQLLTHEDADVAENIQHILEDEGIKVFLDAKVNSLKEIALLNINAKIKYSGGKEKLKVTHVLVATGRTPNCESLELAKSNIKTGENGYIAVDASLKTSCDGVFAIGDVKGGPAFTHIAYDDYRILSNHLLNGKSIDFHDRMVPYTIFTDPQLGRIGLTEKAAIEQGFDVKIAEMPLSHAARAIETGETRGKMKVVIDATTDRILGCAILAPEGGEVMSALQMAMMGELPYTEIRDGVFAHPTMTESLNNLFETV
ncbi:MAG: mercuric reductase [Calditrichia bacterium]